MKNLQRGFMVPLLIIVLLTIGGSVYVYSKKAKEPTVITNNTKLVDISDWKKYEAGFGLSLKYPPDWTVTSSGGAARRTPRFSLQNKNNTDHVYVDFYTEKDSLTVDKNFVSISPIIVDGYSTELYSVPELSRNNNDELVPNGNKGLIYKINLGERYGMDINIQAATSVGNLSIQPSDEVIQIISSIRIDKIMLDNSLSALREYYARGEDTVVKFNLGNTRMYAEVYYDKSNSYAGFCTQEQNQKDLKTFFSTINAICKDSRGGYAISAPLPLGGFWCVDSKGYSGNVKYLNTQVNCENKMNQD